jgi:hypothetical protein
MSITPAPDRFQLTPLLPGQQPSDLAIAHGSYRLVDEFLGIHRVRADTLDRMADVEEAKVDLAEREQQLQTTRLQVLNTMLDAIAQRLDALELKHEDQRKADEAAEQQRIEDELARLPDPDFPDSAPGHFNTGDLSPLPPTVDGDTDDQGDLPRSLDPDTPTGLDPRWADPRNRNQVPQPVSVSLNEADDQEITLSAAPLPGM